MPRAYLECSAESLGTYLHGVPSCPGTNPTRFIASVHFITRSLFEFSPGAEQGGPGTLKTVLASAKQRHPVLIVSDSGGAAAAIAEYVQAGGTSSTCVQYVRLRLRACARAFGRVYRALGRFVKIDMMTPTEFSSFVIDGHLL